MSDNKTIDNVHVHIYGHEMLGEVISRARKNNIPYDKDMYYDFHSHGHVYLVHQQGQLTLVEDPSEKHGEEISLNGFFELYLSKEEVKKELEVGKWYKHPNGEYPDWLVCYGENKICYGFTVRGKWNYDYGEGWFEYLNSYPMIEATPQEVEKALIEEAKRLGFKGGFIFDERTNILWNQKDNGEETAVLSNGKWASIVEQIKEKPKVGDVCKFWNYDENNFEIAKLVRIYSEKETYKYASGASSWINAKTLTQQEVNNLLFGKENVDD